MSATKKGDEFGYKPKESDKKESGIKTTYVGTRKVRDIVTGEVIELEYIQKEVEHTLKGGWRRVYMENFMELITGLYSSGRKIDVIEFILSNLDTENKLTMTQEQVIEKSGISKMTVVNTYKHLIENNFMKKVGTAYIINPKYVCAFGSDKKNKRIMIEYNENEEQSLFNEQELKNA